MEKFSYERSSKKKISKGIEQINNIKKSGRKQGTRFKRLPDQ